MAIDLKTIKELREVTGAGVLDAKKALESSGGDFDGAVKVLREKGLAKAARRADRDTTEGRIEARGKGSKVGMLVEVNCETDFVGRNDNFVAFANQVADHFFAVSTQDQPLDELLDSPIADDGNATAASLMQDMISSTGENMAIRRFARFELGDKPGMIELYMHPGNRVAVMLELVTEDQAVAESDEFSSLAHDIALHIAAMAPQFLTREQVPADMLDAEKEIYRKQALQEGKPEKIVERIVEGRFKKFYQETVLLEQPFVKDDKIAISQLLKKAVAELGGPATISRFARYELGESLD